MRFLHTSDWHLGRAFHGESLLSAQHDFLRHLVEVVRGAAVDAVLVAGDIYDRALPSLDAISLFDDVLHRLADLGVPTVMISGNHDSPRRLGVGAGLIRQVGIHLRTDPSAVARPVVLQDDHGPVALYGLPYLEPALVRETLQVDRAGHTAVLGAAMDQVRQDLAQRPGTRSVVLAHAFVVGGSGCDSERNITVGGVQDVPASVFAGADYVALGHLHGAQSLSSRMRYSGSPLPYSFSETSHRKTMWLIDLDDRGQVAAERIDCPVARPLARLRGRLSELLADAALAPHANAWVQVTLTDPQRPAEPMERLRRRFPGTVALNFEPDTADTARTAVSYASRLRGRDDLQIGLDFVTHVRGRDADDSERALLSRAFDSVRVTTDSESGDPRHDGKVR